MMQQAKGKLIKFDTIKQGKALVKLSDGNYLEVILLVHKVLKSDQLNPAGEPVYAVQNGVAVVIWKPEEIAQLEKEEEIIT